MTGLSGSGGCSGMGEGTLGTSGGAGVSDGVGMPGTGSVGGGFG